MKSLKNMITLSPVTCHQTLPCHLSRGALQWPHANGYSMVTRDRLMANGVAI